jgi:hypothetical protein
MLWWGWASTVPVSSTGRYRFYSKAFGQDKPYAIRVISSLVSGVVCWELLFPKSAFPGTCLFTFQNMLFLGHTCWSYHQAARRPPPITHLMYGATTFPSAPSLPLTCTTFPSVLPASCSCVSKYPLRRAPNSSRAHSVRLPARSS